MNKSPVQIITIHGIFLEMTCMFAFCAYAAFSVSSLVDNGWTRESATAFLTVLAVVTMIIQPVYGYISDNIFSEKKLTVFLLLGTAVCMGVLPLAFNSKNTIFIILNFIGITIFSSCIGGMIDAWLVSLKQNYSELNYGLIRGFGSLAYAIAAQSMGHITDIFGHNTRYIIAAIFMLFAALSAIALQAAKKTQTQKIDSSKESLSTEIKRLSGKEAFKSIFSSKQYILILCVGFSAMLINAAITTLIQIVVPELGGNITQVGMASAVMAICEVPCMFFMASLIKKFDEKKLMTAACAFFTIRMLLSATVNSVAIFVVVQVLHGLTYAVVQPVSMSYLSKICEERTRSTAVNTYVAISTSFSTICSNGIISIALATGLTAQKGFFIFAIVAAIGFTVSVYGIFKKIW